MLQGECHDCANKGWQFLSSSMMFWLILLVSETSGGGIGGHGDGGRGTLSVGTGRSTLDGDLVFCSGTLGASGAVSTGGYTGCSVTLRSA